MAIEKFKVGDRVKLNRIYSFGTAMIFDKIGTVGHIITFNKHQDVAYTVYFPFEIEVNGKFKNYMNLWHHDLTKVENPNDILKDMITL